MSLIFVTLENFYDKTRCHKPLCNDKALRWNFLLAVFMTLFVFILVSQFESLGFTVCESHTKIPASAD